MISKIAGRLCAILCTAALIGCEGLSATISEFDADLSTVRPIEFVVTVIRIPF